MQQSQSHDLMQDYSRAQMEYSKMLLLPYQQPPPAAYQPPIVGVGQVYQQQQQQQMMQPAQMLLAQQAQTASSNHQHTFSRLQQHPEQLHLHPSNQSVVHKAKNSLAHHLSRCHIHPVRQLTNSQCYHTSARVRQLNSYLDDQHQQQQLASLAQTAATISVEAMSGLSYTGPAPETESSGQYSLGSRQRVGSVSCVLSTSPSETTSTQQQSAHIPCLMTLNTIGQQTSVAPHLEQRSIVRATSAPQSQPNTSYYGLSPKSSSTVDTMSPNGALSLGINLEQYISKRNERERSRVKNVNDAFDNLKCSLPLDSEKVSKRISKVEILRTAISYIRNLESLLSEQPTSDSSQLLASGIVKRSPDQVSTNINSPTGVALTTPETNATGSQIYLAYQQAEKHKQLTTLTGANDSDFKQVHSQVASEQDYMDLMNSLEYENAKLDY